MTDLGPGVQVRCVKRGVWRTLAGDWHSSAPKFGEICTIIEAYQDSLFAGVETFLTLEGFVGGWAAAHFRPIDPDISELQKLLTNIPKFDLVDA